MNKIYIKITSVEDQQKLKSYLVLNSYSTYMGGSIDDSNITKSGVWVDLHAKELHKACTVRVNPDEQTLMVVDEFLAHVNGDEEKPPVFPNGFTSWYETFYHFTQDISHAVDIDKDTHWCSIQENHGHTELISEAKDLTDKFEEKFKGQAWVDLDWYDEMEKYFDEYTESQRDDVNGDIKECGVEDKPEVFNTSYSKELWNEIQKAISLTTKGGFPEDTWEGVECEHGSMDLHFFREDEGEPECNTILLYDTKVQGGVACLTIDTSFDIMIYNSDEIPVEHKENLLLWKNGK